MQHQATLDDFEGFRGPAMSPGKENRNPNLIVIDSDSEDAPMVAIGRRRSRYVDDEAVESSASDSDSFVVSDHDSSGSAGSQVEELRSAIANIRRRRGFGRISCPDCIRLHKAISIFLDHLAACNV